MRLTDQVAYASSIDPACGDDAVIRHNAPCATAAGYTLRCPAHRDALEHGLGASAARRIEFRGIEVGEAHLNPCIGIIGLTDA